METLQGIIILGDLAVGRICSEIRESLKEAVKNNLSEGILLSGGLDTSILSVIASKLVPLKAVTIALQDSPAPDLKYSALMAKRLGLEHIIHVFDEEELYSAAKAVVRTLQSFDPMEIRNSITIYIGMKTSREQGLTEIMTGDGCDELLAGYSYLFPLERKKLDLELQKLWNVMSFSSIPLAKTQGVEARLPYLDPKFRDFAMKIDSRYKIRRENDQIYGKWILRKAFEEYLPREIAWRIKTPIEYGSGTTTLPSFFNAKITDKELKDKKERYLSEDRVRLRDKEQLFYYEIYKSSKENMRRNGLEGKKCPQCNSNVPEKATIAGHVARIKYDHRKESVL